VKRIKVLVVDDHTLVRDGIRALLALVADVEVVGEATNGMEALQKVRQLEPDVVLMDLAMLVMSGLEATRQIARECPQTKVLILTQYDDEENMLVAKQTGARGFIPKRAASSDVVTGIKSVFAGHYFPQSFASITAS
jgi:DNA-binding NarL/FixJ family response regulator